MDQGISSGSQEENTSPNPLFDEAFFINEKEQALAQSLTLEESLSKILAEVREYYQINKWDFSFISKQINSALNTACDKQLLGILQSCLDQAMIAKTDLSSVCLAFVGVHTNCAKSKVEGLGFESLHVKAVAEMRDFMLSREADSKAINLVFADCIRLIRSGFNGKELELYVEALKVEAAWDLRREPYIDLFGDIARALEDLRKLGILPREIEALGKEIANCSSRNGSIVVVLEQVTEAVKALQFKIDQEDLTDYRETIHNFVSVAGFSNLDVFLDCLINLRKDKASPQLEEVFIAAAEYLAAAKGSFHLQLLYKICRDLRETPPHPQILVNLNLNIRKGYYTEPQMLLGDLNLIAANSHAIGFFTTDLFTQSEKHHHLMSQFVKTALGLKSERFQNQIQSVEQSVFLRARDIHHGFSADLFPCKRTPTREAPEMVRFGRDIAEVKYVNAKTPAEFPGRGFLIKNFRLGDIFARDEVAQAAGQEPFKAYLDAWPKLAPQFRQFAEAEIVYTRGMKIVSCRSKHDYHLTFSDGSREQVSLVIFNDHFKNESSKGVYLVPTRALMRFFAGTFVSGDDFRGFETARPDINQVIKSPADLLEHPLCKDKILRLDDAQSLLFGFRNLMHGYSSDLDKVAERNALFARDFRGFETARPDINQVIKSPADLLEHPLCKDKILRLDDAQSLLFGFRNLMHGYSSDLDKVAERNALFARYEKLNDQHSKLVRDWDAKGHWYHVSREGKHYYDTTIEPSETNLFRLRLQIAELNSEVRKIAEKNHAFIQGLHKTGWEVAERLLNIHDLFLISKSYWERGYTQGSILNEDGFEFEQQETEIQIEEGEGVYWNQNAARMLRLAYEWHSQHENGIEDRDQYPILLATNARNQSQVDQGIFMLDTFDMTVTIEGQKIELTQGQMDSDDELFWHTRILPRTADRPGKIIGLRFYPRKSIGIS